MREWKKQKVWKNRIGDQGSSSKDPQESQQNEYLADEVKSPVKPNKRLSIDDRAGVDSHLIRDSYNSVMHMLRKDPSKKSAHLPLQELEKK